MLLYYVKIKGQQKAGEVIGKHLAGFLKQLTTTKELQFSGQLLLQSLLHRIAFPVSARFKSSFFWEETKLFFTWSFPSDINTKQYQYLLWMIFVQTLYSYFNTVSNFCYGGLQNQNKDTYYSRIVRDCWNKCILTRLL